MRTSNNQHLTGNDDWNRHAHYSHDCSKKTVLPHSLFIWTNYSSGIFHRSFFGVVFLSWQRQMIKQRAQSEIWKLCTLMLFSCWHVLTFLCFQNNNKKWKYWPGGFPRVSALSWVLSPTLHSKKMKLGLGNRPYLLNKSNKCKHSEAPTIRHNNWRKCSFPSNLKSEWYMVIIQITKQWAWSAASVE